MLDSPQKEGASGAFSNLGAPMKNLYLGALFALLAAAPVAAQDTNECINTIRLENGWSDRDLSTLPVGQTVRYRGETYTLRSGGTISLVCKEAEYDQAIHEIAALRARNSVLMRDAVVLTGHVAAKDTQIETLEKELASVRGRYWIEQHPRYLLGAISVLLSLWFLSWRWSKRKRRLYELTIHGSIASHRLE